MKLIKQYRAEYSQTIGMVEIPKPEGIKTNVPAEMPNTDAQPVPHRRVFWDEGVRILVLHPAASGALSEVWQTPNGWTPAKKTAFRVVGRKVGRVSTEYVDRLFENLQEADRYAENQQNAGFKNAYVIETEVFQ